MFNKFLSICNFKPKVWICWLTKLPVYSAFTFTSCLCFEMLPVQCNQRNDRIRILQRWRFRGASCASRDVYSFSSPRNKISQQILVRFSQNRAKMLYESFHSQMLWTYWNPWALTFVTVKTHEHLRASKKVEYFKLMNRKEDGGIDSKGQFHQRLTSSLCARRSQKRKNILDHLTEFLCFWDLRA